METQKIKIKTAIVILNWNGRSWLENFLPSVIMYSKDAEIFVIDNGSTDDSVSFLNENFRSVIIIKNNKNLGFAGGYNTGLNKIHAEYYILLNSDIEVTKDWIEPIIELMEIDNNIAACQPKLLNYNKKTKFEYAGASGGFIDNLGYPFCRGRIFNNLEEDKGQYNDAIEIFWATGACLFIRTDLFWNVGGFDEDFFCHQEEIDLCWRLKNKGYKMMVQPNSKVYHVGGGTLNEDSPYKTYLNFRNNLYMIFKNIPLSYLFFVISMRLILDAVAAFSFLIQGKGLQHFWAIGKAHFVFYVTVPRLISKRQKIKQIKKLTGKFNWSIIYRNKLQGIKCFSDL